jgi:hypothetical protein
VRISEIEYIDKLKFLAKGSGKSAFFYQKSLGFFPEIPGRNGIWFRNLLPLACALYLSGLASTMIGYVKHRSDWVSLLAVAIRTAVSF